MPLATASSEQKERHTAMSNPMYIVCVSGTHEKLQMAGMFASVAVACDIPVTVFFSMNALLPFVKGRRDEAPAEGEFATFLKQKGVPPFKTLFEQASELGDAKLLPCSMAVDLLRIEESDLDPAFGPPTGLAHFLTMAEGGQLLSF